MTEKLSNCPICGTSLVVNGETRGDWTNYKCPNHGEFNLSGTLSVMAVRTPEKQKNIADYLKKNPSERKSVICTYDVNLGPEA